MRADEDTEPVSTGDRLTVEEPVGFTQLPDTLLLDTGISDGAIRLYCLIKHRARSKGHAWPGRRRLAQDSGVRSVRTIDSRLEELRVAGYLVVTPRWRPDGGRSSNDYHLRFYPVPAAPAIPEQGSGGDGEHVRDSQLQGVGAADCRGPVHADGQPSPDAQHPKPEEGTTGGAESAVTARRVTPEDGGVVADGAEPGSAEAASAAAGVDLVAFVRALPPQLQPRTTGDRVSIEGALSAEVEQGAQARVLMAVLSAALPAEVAAPAALVRHRLTAWRRLREEETYLAGAGEGLARAQVQVEVEPQVPVETCDSELRFVQVSGATGGGEDRQSGAGEGSCCDPATRRVVGEDGGQGTCPRCRKLGVRTVALRLPGEAGPADGLGAAGTEALASAAVAAGLAAARLRRGAVMGEEPLFAV